MADDTAAFSGLAGANGAFVPFDPVFTGDEQTEAATLVETWVTELSDLEEASVDDPLINPILELSRRLSRRVAAGEVSYEALEQAVQYLSAEGFVERAARLGLYVGELDPAANRATLEALFERLACPPVDPAGTPGPAVAFEDFQAAVEREYFGFVFTAHPTFNLSGPLMDALSTLAARRLADGTTLDDGEAVNLIREASRSEHKPDGDMSLVREHSLSVRAIGGAQEAIRTAFEAVFMVARRHWPDQWRNLSPRLMTVASWVGYDLDGRSDIRWSDSLRKRLVIQRVQMERHLDRLRIIRAAVGDGPAGESLDLMESRLALAVTQLRDEVSGFDGLDPADPDHVDALQMLSRRMVEGLPLRLVEPARLVETLDRTLDRVDPDHPAAVDLAVMRAELRLHGLALAHTHVRINATQVHNAIRKAVGIGADVNDPRFRQSYLDRIDQLLDEVQPLAVNFGSLVAERTSVKQLFMVIAQMRKFADRQEPVRFLIAECESAFTALVALYYARLFDVEEIVDISPLFETERALEVGSRVVEQLLENRHYRAYVERRGRLSVQTGYSDAGRYLGQTAAAASIERLRFRLIKAMAKHGMTHVQLLIFDTHGESIGRGAHPGSFTSRLTYIDPPASRVAMAENGQSFKQEMSFQGGDGYLYFLNPALALGVVTRIVDHCVADLTPPTGATVPADPFYAERAYIREFFTTVKEFQVDLMDDPNYGVLLGTFGASLLFRSGSRAFKRQHEEPIGYRCHAGQPDPRHSAQRDLDAARPDGQFHRRPRRGDVTRSAALHRFVSAVAAVSSAAGHRRICLRSVEPGRYGGLYRSHRSGLLGAPGRGGAGGAGKHADGRRHVAGRPA